MSQTVAPRLQILRFLWLAQLGSVGLLVVVCGVATRGTLPVNLPLVATLRPLFWILAFVLAALSIAVRRWFVTTLPPGPLGAPPADQALGRLQATCVIVWAMSEAVAALGLVLGMLAGNIGELLPFASAALALLYVHRPGAWPLDAWLHSGAGITP